MSPTLGDYASKGRHALLRHPLAQRQAVEAFAGGDSLTEAAHAAGFSDSAHFSRTFRRMFGLAAAALRLA